MALLFALALTSALAVLILRQAELLRLGEGGVSTLGVVLSALSLACVASTAPKRIWSAGFLFLFMIVLFHLGIPLLKVTGTGVPSSLGPYLELWYGGSSTTKAIYLSTLAVVAFAAGHQWLQLRRPQRPTPIAEAKALGERYGRLGFWLILTGVILYLGSILVFAPDALTTGNYAAYNDGVGDNGTIAAGTMLVAFGMIFTAVGSETRRRTASIGLLIAYALVALWLGSRTAVMFPLVGAVAARARVSRMPRARVAVFVLLGALVLISAVRISRTDNSNLGIRDLNPISAVAEMGTSLRPVYEVITWQEELGQSPTAGQTYVAPFIRLYEAVLGKERPPGSTDTRLAGVLLAQRVAVFQIGFSAVAEAYLNFSDAGVVFIFLALGIGLGFADRSRTGNPTTAAALGIVVYALAYHVRNSSNAIPATIAIGLVLLLLAHIPRPYRARGRAAFTSLRLTKTGRGLQRISE